MTTNPIVYGRDYSNTTKESNAIRVDSDGRLVTMPLYDKGDIDVFGVQRVSQNNALFESTCQYNKISYIWEDALTGGGTTTHNPNSSSVSMNVGTTSGDKVIRQTHKYIKYSPDEGQLVKRTITFAPVK